uniref:hydrogen gas-evolving membrane-bound hydrogenase subunit E n=1 Tax=Streptomyces sp. YIM 98790 TaxID=2689077 RepID=UPI002442AA54
AAVAAATAALAAAAVPAFTGRPDVSPLGQELLDRSVPETGGHNAVNVILVEFRALDTLGEALVLGAATLGLMALLAPRHVTEPVPASGPGIAPDPGADRMVFRASGRVLGPLMLLVAAWLLLRGHNAPGGGFIAALVTGAAVALGRAAQGRLPRAAERDLRPLPLLSSGVLLALGTASAPLFAGEPFFTPMHTTLPLLSLKLSSGLLFDLAIFLIVTGMLAAAVDRLSSGRGKVRP